MADKYYDAAAGDFVAFDPELPLFADVTVVEVVEVAGVRQARVVRGSVGDSLLRTLAGHRPGVFAVETNALGAVNIVRSGEPFISIERESYVEPPAEWRHASSTEEVIAALRRVIAELERAASLGWQVVSCEEHYFTLRPVADE